MKLDKLFIHCIEQKKSPKKYIEKWWKQSNHKMDAVFINSKNNRITDPYNLLLNLTGEMNLKRGDKYITLHSNLSIYCTLEKHGKVIKDNAFKIWPPTWNEEFKLLSESYFVSDIRHYCQYFIEKHENSNSNIYKQIEKTITLEIKTGYVLELLTPGTMELLKNTEMNVNKDKDGENVPNLEAAEMELSPCNVGIINYQENWKVLYTFIQDE